MHRVYTDQIQPFIFYLSHSPHDSQSLIITFNFLFKTSTYGENMQCLSFCVWFVSLNRVSSVPSILLQWQYLILYSWIILLCVHVCAYKWDHVFFYPFVCWWASRLISCLSYYKHCCNKHGCAGFPLVCWFNFLWRYTQKLHFQSSFFLNIFHIVARVI